MLNNLIAYLTVAVMDIKEGEEGQGLVEYALILVLVSVVSIVALRALGVAIGPIFDQVTAAL